MQIKKFKVRMLFFWYYSIVLNLPKCKFEQLETDYSLCNVFNNGELSYFYNFFSQRNSIQAKVYITIIPFCRSGGGGGLERRRKKDIDNEIQLLLSLKGIHAHCKHRHSDSLRVEVFSPKSATYRSYRLVIHPVTDTIKPWAEMWEKSPTPSRST